VPPHYTEGLYEFPASAGAVAKGYPPRDQFAGYERYIQRPVFAMANTEHVVKEVMAELEAKATIPQQRGSTDSVVVAETAPAESRDINDMAFVVVLP